jgi:hypothetical protein
MRAWQVNGIGEPADVLRLTEDVELSAAGEGARDRANRLAMGVAV